MGKILLKGEKFEIVKLDTHDGNVKIKGKIYSYAYIDNNENKERESFISRLFK